MQKYWGIILVLTLMASCKDANDQKNDIAQDISVIEVPEVNERFGFNLDEFNVKLDTVRYGDSFGELMQEHKVDYPKVLSISENFRDSFDVRKIRVGKPYVILQSKDTLAQAQVFIYENDPINYTVVDLRDSVKVYKDKNKVKFVQREVSGIIESSLSEAILDQGVDYNVTHNLANVYAWTIDFSRLQKNDKFKIIYNEKYINDTVYAGAEPIEA
ncbi:MAG: M23 family peptidase, partial [Maribacter stanieri]